MSLINRSVNCARYMLLAFNLVVILSGTVLIAVAVNVTNVFEEYELFLVQEFFWLPMLLIAIGALVISVALFGCWVALKGNYCTMIWLSVLMGMIFLLELLAGISSFMLRDNTEGYINVTLISSMPEYQMHSNPYITVLWDTLQKEFACCGVASYKDWEPYFETNLPLSCCAIPNGVVDNFRCTPVIEDANRYPAGCMVYFSEYIAAHVASLATAGIVIAIIQFFGVIFVCYIAREIKIRTALSEKKVQINENLFNYINNNESDALMRRKEIVYSHI